MNAWLLLDCSHLNALVGTVELLAQEIDALPDNPADTAQGPLWPLREEPSDSAASEAAADSEGASPPFQGLLMPGAPAPPAVAQNSDSASGAQPLAMAPPEPPEPGSQSPLLAAKSPQAPQPIPFASLAAATGDEYVGERKAAGPDVAAVIMPAASETSSSPSLSSSDASRASSSGPSRRAGVATKATMTEYLSMMRGAAERMGHHLDDMMDLTRLQRGQLPLNPRAVDIRATLLSLIIPLQTEARVPIQIDIQTQVNGKSVVAVIDETRFSQAVSNAITNAIKYTTEGSITVRCSIDVGAEASQRLANVLEAQGAREESFVAVQSPTEASSESKASQDLSNSIGARFLKEVKKQKSTMGVLQLYVEDTGPGLRGLTSAQVFRPFVSMTSPDKQDEQSSGLGLSICSLIASAMHGAVNLEDTGHGCRFSFLVPVEFRRGSVPSSETAISSTTTSSSDRRTTINSDVTMEEEKKAPGRGGRGLQKRVLVVDDDHTNVKLVGRMLRLQGCSVDTISSGHIGEQIEQRLKAAGHCGGKSVDSSGDDALDLGFDAVLLDIRLGPTENGVDIARRLLPACSDAPPFIAMTANTRPIDIQEYKSAGFAGLVAKPVSTRTLKSALTAVSASHTEFEWFQ